MWGLVMLTSLSNVLRAEVEEKLPQQLSMIGTGSEYAADVQDCVSTPDGERCLGKKVVFTVAETNVKTYFRTRLHASCFPVGLELLVADDKKREILREVYPPTTRGGFFTAKTRLLKKGTVYYATWSAFSVGPFSGCEQDSELVWFGNLKIRESEARYKTKTDFLTPEILR